MGRGTLFLFHFAKSGSVLALDADAGVLDAGDELDELVVVLGTPC